MYWNHARKFRPAVFVLINRNMRCIEIAPRKLHPLRKAWLIETWDVLKYESAAPEYFGIKRINRNMRCIEMSNLVRNTMRNMSINRNMRCIEITDAYDISSNRFWINRNMRCIEISWSVWHTSRSSGINRNMRCIEIYVR